MNASKEQCQDAIVTVADTINYIEAEAPHPEELQARLERVQEFLVAAHRKLPFEAAYAADKTRAKLRKNVSL